MTLLVYHSFFLFAAKKKERIKERKTGENKLGYALCFNLLNISLSIN
jgi:hypothetical protein